ncbi:MAG: dihydroorotase [Candidatus Polarisedimenticolia bacterium]
MAGLLLRGGRVIDPANGIDDLRDVRVDQGRIARVERGLRPQPDERVIECDGAVVAPGFVDMHVHLREPGREDKETIASGSRAAAAGGFTSVACMPNTQPVNDDPSVTEYIKARADEQRRRHDRDPAQAFVKVHPIGAISKGLRGEQLAEIGGLVRQGCVAISDDGHPVSSSFLMRKALEYARMFDVPVINHAQDLVLSNEGVMNEGFHATVLGLKGLNGAAEDVMVYRDIRLAELCGGRLHVPHISTRQSLTMVREARARGVAVTCEATPHHFCLTDEAVCGYDTNTKMNPPLRDESDRAAVLEALADGTIDAVASDHAPHTIEEKDVEYDQAPFGVVGLETSVALGLDRLVGTKRIDLTRFVRLYSTNPASILKLPPGTGTLSVGADADITVFSTSRPTTVDPSHFRSRSRNTPFGGWTLTGAVLATVVSGRVVHQLPL